MLDPVLHHEWHLVARAADLPSGQLMTVQLLGEALLLWRCETEILAWRDRCPHRGVPLSNGWIEDGCSVVCPYHGLVFDALGQCTRVPADPHLTTFPPAAHVQTYSVQERYGYVWVALGAPTQDIPTFPEWEQPGFITFHCGPYPINASPLRVIENFTDVAHLPFAHPGLLGDPQFPEVSHYRLTTDETGITAHDIQFHQPNPEGTGEAKTVSYCYKILRPLIAYFEKTSAEQHFSIFLAVTPVAETQTIAWLGVCRNYAAETPNDELRAFQDHLMTQDIPLVESQRPQLLPLNLQAEFHIPADQLSIAYRKWLLQQGVTFGAVL